MKKYLVITLIVFCIIACLFLTGCKSNKNKLNQNDESATEIADEVNNKKGSNYKPLKMDELIIILNEKKYSYPFTLNDLINDGWEADNTTDERSMEEILYPNKSDIIHLDLGKNLIDFTAYITNKSNENIRPTDCKIENFTIWESNENEKIILEIAGIKTGDKSDAVKKILGKPKDTYTDESSGFYNYIYNIKLKNEKEIELKFEFSLKENYLYEVTIKPIL